VFGRMIPYVTLRLSTTARSMHHATLSAKRSNKALAAFVARMTAAGKPPKVILVAVARKLLVYAHAVIRTQKAFESSPNAPFST